MGVRAQPGRAHHGRPDRDPGAAGQAVVGDPAAVRLAAGRQARRSRSSGSRSCCSSARACSSSPPACSTSRSSTRGTSGSCRAHYYGAWIFISALALHVCRQAADRPRAPTATHGVLRAAEGRSRAHPARALRAGRAGRVRAGVADDQPPRPAGAGRRRLAGAADRQPRRIGRRPAAADRAAGAARAGVRAPAPTTSRSTRPPTSSASPSWPAIPRWRLSWPGARTREAQPPAADGDAAAHLRRCRSRASRDGRRPSAGPACGCGTWPRWSAPRRARSWRSTRCSRTGPFTHTAYAAAQVQTTDRCWRCASTASTSRSITAIRRGSSSRRCRACTAPSGSARCGSWRPDGRAFAALYGSNPLHLLGHLGVFFIAGWAIEPDPRRRLRRSTGSRGSSARRCCTTWCCCRCTRRLTAG